MLTVKLILCGNFMKENLSQSFPVSLFFARVIEHGDENRMTLQNVAIVFGPTLLKPEMESANITAYMVFQNQIIEFILSEFEAIFHM